jgi:hypothetical protein
MILPKLLTSSNMILVSTGKLTVIGRRRGPAARHDQQTDPVAWATQSIR